MTTPSLTRPVLLLLAGIVLTNPGFAQQPRRAWVGVTGGLSLLGPGTIARDYNAGPNVSLTASVRAVGRLSIRASVERARLPYDRTRFFRLLGISRIELESQLGAGAQLTNWSVGPELAIWNRPHIEAYSFGTVGRDSRTSGTGPLLALYCGPPTVIYDADGTTRTPAGWTAPQGCHEAQAGTRIDGRGVSLAVGGGLRWRAHRRTALMAEAGYVRSLLSPRGSIFPLRVGLGVSF